MQGVKGRAADVAAELTSRIAALFIVVAGIMPLERMRNESNRGCVLGKGRPHPAVYIADYKIKSSVKPLTTKEED